MPDKSAASSEVAGLLFYILGIFGAIIAALLGYFIKQIFANIAEIKQELRDGIGNIFRVIDRRDEECRQKFAELYERSNRDHETLARIDERMNNILEEHDKNHG